MNDSPSTNGADAADGPNGLGGPCETGTGDPLVNSALLWCARRGIAGLTLAVPFPLPEAVVGRLCDLVRSGTLASLVLFPPVSVAVPAERIGRFRPTDENWDLPRLLGREILYLGTRSTLPARMLKAAILRGVGRVSYRTLDGWARSSFLALALGKLWGKALAACERLAWRWVDGPCAAVLERIHGRRIRALLAVGPPSHPPGTGSGIVIACPTLVAGGAERQIVNTVLGLHRLGIAEVTVLVARLRSPPGNDFFLPPLESAGVAVRELCGPAANRRGWELTHGGGWQGPAGRRALAALKSLPAVLAEDVAEAVVLLRELRPAVVHCWLDYSNIRVGLAAALAGVPRIVLAGRNVSPVHFAYIHESFMRAAYRALAERPEVLLVNNSRGGAEDYGRWLGLAPERFRIVYNGADLAATVRAAPDAIARERGRWSAAPGAPLVGGLFRFSDEKRPLLWLKTAALVAGDRPDVRFVLFGAGPREPQMRAFLAAQGLAERVRIAPPTPDSALALSAFDLLLLTSRWEGTPNVAIEAQAVGTPVVATGGGGAREALDPGVTGLFVEAPDARVLARTIAALLADPARRAAMGAAGPGFVRRRFAMDTMLRETLSAYGLGPADGPQTLKSAGAPSVPAAESLGA